MPARRGADEFVAGQIKVSLFLLAVIALITAFWFIGAAAFPLSYAEEIRAAAERSGLDEDLVRGVIWAESKYREDAVSPAGATGLMQLMPGTRAWISGRTGIAADGSAGSEIMLGCMYLSYLTDVTGSETDALMSYNAGYANVLEWKKGGEPFPETLEYVRRVFFARRVYSLL